MGSRKFLGIILGIGAMCAVALGAVSVLGEAPAVPPLAAQERDVLSASVVLETVEATQDRTEQNVLPQAAEKQFVGQENRQNGSVQQETRGKEEGVIQAEIRAPGVSSEVLVPEGSTVYDLMTAVAGQSDFRFRGKDFWGLGFFVEEINGLAENPKERMRWIYYINGETALVGVSQYVVQTNDIIEWRYEKEH